MNLRDIARRFESGADVTPEAMLAARVVRTLRHPVKVLGVGEVPGPLNVSAHGFSASARQKIEAAGGTATVIEELVVVETIVIADESVADEPGADEPADAEAVVEETAIEETQPESDEAPGDEAEA